MNSVDGHCLCGRVSFTLDGPHNWVGHCHCDSCRRATASPITTFIGHPDGHWTIVGSISKFKSSANVTRAFCGHCGSQVFYQTSTIPNETHFYAALLDNPISVHPTVHWHYDEALPWLHLSDDATKKGV